jgi:hypothetical protein
MDSFYAKRARFYGDNPLVRKQVYDEILDQAFQAAPSTELGVSKEEFRVAMLEMMKEGRKEHGRKTTRTL